MVFLKDHWGDIASALGLLISVFAFLKARSAFHLASLRSRLADVSPGIELTSALTKAIEQGDVAAAAPLARDLHAHLTWFTARWGASLRGNLAREMSNAQLQIGIVCSRLNSAQVGSSVRLDVAACLKETQTASTLFNSLKGHTQHLLER